MSNSRIVKAAYNNNYKKEDEQCNTVMLYNDISLQIKQLQEFNRKIALFQNELKSLSELRESLEKYSEFPLLSPTQMISLLTTDMRGVELRINEKTAIANQLHKQIKSSSGVIEMKESKVNSIKAKMIEISQLKEELNKKVKLFEDIIASNNNFALTQREKCDVLKAENERLMMQISAIIKENQGKDHLQYQHQLNEERVNDDRLNDMTALISQLEKKRELLRNRIKEDIISLKESKIKVLKDKLKKKKEKNALLFKEQRDMDLNIELLREVFNAYSKQSKEISDQLKYIEEGEAVIKKNSARKETINYNLLSNIQ